MPAIGGDLLVPHLALFHQFEIKGQHGKIAAARAPGGMVGRHFLFGQRLALGCQAGAGAVRTEAEFGRVGISDSGFTHKNSCCQMLKVTVCASRRRRRVLARSRISRTRQVKPSVLFRPRILRQAKAGAQDAGQLAVAVKALVVHLHHNDVVEAGENVFQSRRQRADVPQIAATETLSPAARARSTASRMGPCVEPQPTSRMLPSGGP